MEKESNISVLLTSILYLILGIIFIAATEELLKTVNYILVCLCAIIGVIQLINFFISKKYKHNNYMELIISVIFIWASLVLYVSNGYINFFILPTLFSLYLFVIAVSMIAKFINTKDNPNINRKKYLILSLLAIVVGLLLIFNPKDVIFTYIKITGVFLILISGLTFMDFLKLTKKEDSKADKK